MRKPRFIHPFGAGGLLLEWEQRIDPGISDGVHTYAAELRKHPAVTECVPAYASLLVSTSGGGDTVDRVREFIYALRPAPRSANEAYLHELPVCYGGDHGPDLDWVAKHCNLDEQEVIELHTSATYVVYFLGFQLGFGFMGQIHEMLEVPRKNDPRASVPSGSVALAGRQTGIYPEASPGGWQLIGRCPLPLIGREDDLTRFRAGDQVRFHSVCQQEYECLLKKPSPWPQR